MAAGRAMTAFTIRAARLDLVLRTPEEILAWVASLHPADRAEFSPDWIDRVRSTAAGDPWSLGYAAVERASGLTVGGCSFKGPPDAEGVVEVAYGVDAPHRSGGFATEMTEALTAFAFSEGRVTLVRAHTKPDNAASARVLEKCGFRWIGDVIDPEDGSVRRWERFRPPGIEAGGAEAVVP